VNIPRSLSRLGEDPTQRGIPTAAARRQAQDSPAGNLGGSQWREPSPTWRHHIPSAIACMVLRADSASMTFYLAQGKGLPCRRHPVISVQ
jgi:hypothetical protein